MITSLRNKPLEQVRADVAGFSQRYVRDWERWLLATSEKRPEVFVTTLGKWAAARPARLRRLRVRAGEHPPPYIEDLLALAVPHLEALANFSVRHVQVLTHAQQAALAGLWNVFLSLRQVGPASCVTITKAALLLSDGRIGPAFDSQVRRKLNTTHLLTSAEWSTALCDVSADIRAFEEKHGVTFSDAVPPQYRNLAYGRLYDMALGPR